MCAATVPQHWGRNGFPDKAKDHVQDQKRDHYSNDDYSFIPSHLFTMYEKKHRTDGKRVP